MHSFNKKNIIPRSSNKKLFSDLDSHRSLDDGTPCHVAIVMDGNVRWSIQQNVSRAEGHSKGVKQAQEIILAAQDKGIEYLSLFAFSKENWDRPSAEVTELLDLIQHNMPDNNQENFFIRHQLNLRIIGDISDFPVPIQKRVTQTTQLCSSYSGITVVIGLSYGAKQDITRAIKHLVRCCIEGKIDIDAIDEEAVQQSLSTYDIPPVDLLIRTSGELRISNFMLWELAYAEMYFTTVLWPDFSCLHFQAALESFKLRKRRFGRRR